MRGKPRRLQPTRAKRLRFLLLHVQLEQRRKLSYPDVEPLTRSEESEHPQAQRRILTHRDRWIQGRDEAPHPEQIREEEQKTVALRLPDACAGAAAPH